MRKVSRQAGFTLIEMLMVIMLVGILAAVAIPQFLDFRTEARDAATNSALGTLRTSIAAQIGQMVVRCGVAAGTIPGATTVNANDITVATGTDTAYCTTAQVGAAERAFVAGGIPANPWGNQKPTEGTIGVSAVTACTAGAGCNKTAACGGGAFNVAANVGGWCYDPAKGTIWANSDNSPTHEYNF